MLQNKLRTLILDDLQEKGPPLNRILNSKCCCANSLTYLENATDIIQKEKPDLLGVLKYSFLQRRYYVGTGLVPVLTPSPMRTATRAVPTITSDFSEASIIRILQKVRENNPSLPILVCSDSVTKQFKNQATHLGVSVFFRKQDVIRQPPVWAEQMLDQIKKIVAPRRADAPVWGDSVNDKESGFATPKKERKEVKEHGSRKEHRIFQLSGSGRQNPG